MPTPAALPLPVTRLSASQNQKDNTPIRVRRLKQTTVHACSQKNSVTGLYIGQAATLDTGGELRDFSAGDLLILTDDARVDVERAVEVWVLEFGWDALAPFVSGAGHTFPAWRQFAATLQTFLGNVKRYTVPLDEHSTWERCLQTLDRELRTQRLGYCENAKAHLTLLLVNLARLIEEEITSLPLADDPLVAKVLAYIEAHFHERVTLEQLAQHVHRSPNYLTTKVREQIGQSVMDYVIDRRMQEAETLLQTTDQLVNVIGETIGYPEPSTFSRQFRKRHGLSPAAWRKANRSKSRA